MEKTDPARRILKIGTSIDPSADYGPLVDEGGGRARQEHVDIGIKGRLRRRRSTARSFKMQG